MCQAVKQKKLQAEEPISLKNEKYSCEFTHEYFSWSERVFSWKTDSLCIYFIYAISNVPAIQKCETDDADKQDGILCPQILTKHVRSC